MLVSSIFSFFRNVFFQLQKQFLFLSFIYFVVCTCFQFRQNFFLCECVENIVGNGENAGNQHFLLFPQCFLKAFYPGSLKVGIMWCRNKHNVCGAGQFNQSTCNWICYANLLEIMIYRKNYQLMYPFPISALWSFLWFVGFCYMTDKWRRRDEVPVAVAPHGHGRDNIQAAIAFSFFSIFTWVSWVKLFVIIIMHM